MNFELSPEILALRTSLAKLLDDHYSLDQRRAIAASAEGFSRPVWEQLCEMGVPALMADPEHGGFGFAATELLPVLEEVGRALVLEPVVSSSLVAAAALRSVAGPELLAELMPPIATGKALITLAHAEPGARHDPAWIRCRAHKPQAVWQLTGHKRDVVHANASDFLLVSAALDTGQPALFLVGRGASGMVLRPYRLLDDTPAAELRMDGTPAVLLAQGDAATTAIAYALDMGIAASAAEAVGVARGALALTVQHLNVRQQFGRPLAANQALRHRVAEMAVALETLRSAAMAALEALAHGNRSDLARAKMLVGRHGVQLAEEAVQLHGGIGITQEYGVGNYLRRMTVIDLMFGDAEYHASRHGAYLIDA